jgi:tRNA-specific 2-thiouridylase
MLSSVVAALLKHQGFQIIGMHFKTDEKAHQEAERISQKLGIPLISEEAVELMNECVYDHIVHQVLANRKPEPAVMGHQKILIERLCLKARELGCGKIATGHVARVVLDPSTGLTRLLRAAEAEHDQSHLLFGMSSSNLDLFILPVGDLNWSAIDRLSVELELDPDNLRKNLPGFCMIPENEFGPMAAARLPSGLKQPGQIKSTDGSVLGEHTGLYQYTFGQSTGFPQVRGQAENLVVVGINHATQTLTLGTDEMLTVKEVFARDVNWIQKTDSLKGLVCEARLRAGVFSKCRVTSFEHGYLHVEFEQPQKRIISGQTVCFYRGEEILGGAFVV